MNFARLLSFCGASLCLLAATVSAEDLSTALYKQPAVSIEQRVQDLLARMTPEEKARQLDLFSGAGKGQDEDPPLLLADRFHVPMHATADTRFLPDHAAKVLGDLGVGGIHDLYPYAALTNSVQEWLMHNTRLGIPAIFIEEGLHGLMSYDSTLFPAPINLGTTWNPELARQTGAAIAAEMRARGIGMCLGPVLDVAREPRWGRVEEGMGEDPYLIGQLGLAYVQGMQGDSLADDRHIIAEPKHFAGHGSPEAGLNTSTVHVSTLR